MSADSYGLHRVVAVRTRIRHILAKLSLPTDATYTRHVLVVLAYLRSDHGHGRPPALTVPRPIRGSVASEAAVLTLIAAL